jgi:hypothetical protein
MMVTTLMECVVSSLQAKQADEETEETDQRMQAFDRSTSAGTIAVVV